MRRWLGAGGLLAVIAVIAALSAVPASAATLPTPTNVTATAQTNAATVFFTAASPPPGVFYSYTVTASPGGMKSIETSGTAPTLLGIGELTNGVTYTFTVTVSDDSGDTSAASAPSNPVTPELPAPGAPVGVTASAGDGQATVSFQNDNDPNSAPVTGYTVTASPGGAQASGTASPITLTGLTDGTSYTFTVTALSPGGNSPPSTPSAPVTPLPPPVNTVAPAIPGQALVDDTVHAEAGTWTLGPNTFAFQWYDCDPVNGTDCVAIDGATSADYTVSPEDGGSALEVSVTATDAQGATGTAMSEPTAAVTQRPGAPAATVLPALGPVDGGEPVTATAPSWSNSPNAFTYQWLSCANDLSTCNAVTAPSSTLSPYSPTSGDAGALLLLEVIATNAVGDSVAVFSAPSAPVVFPPPTISVTYPVNGASYSFYDAHYGLPPQFTCTPALGTQLTACSDSLAIGSQGLPDAAGTDSFEVFAADDDGGSAVATVTYTVAAQPPAFEPGSLLPGPILPARPSLPLTLGFPHLTAVKQSSTRWRAGSTLPNWQSGSPPGKPKTGTYFSFESSAGIPLDFVFRRQTAGRRNGSRCVAPTRRNRDLAPCERFGSAATLSIEASPGANYVSFDGRLSATSRLQPGVYVAKVMLDGTVAATLRFTILK